MKKYLAIIILIISLLPIGVKAQINDEKALQEDCDNEIWREETEVYNYLLTFDRSELSWMEQEFIEDYMKFLIGEPDNRTKYNKRAVRYCVNKEGRYCHWGVFPLYYYNERMVINYPSAALAVNNKELFEALIKEYPFLLDNAVVDYEHYHSNGFFYTPALLMIRNSQYGVLKYLIEKHKVNLLRNSGYIYRDPDKPKAQINALTLATQMLDKWIEHGNKVGIQCAERTLDVVKDWYKKYKSDSQYNNKALKDYNIELNRIANLEDQKAENQMPEQYDGMPQNLFAPEENYAQQIKDDPIEKEITDIRINMLMEKIMRGIAKDIDFSSFGNKAS